MIRGTYDALANCATEDGLRANDEEASFTSALYSTNIPRYDHLR